MFPFFLDFAVFSYLSLRVRGRHSVGHLWTYCRTPSPPGMPLARAAVFHRHRGLGNAVPVSVANIIVSKVSTNSASFILKAANGESNIISRRLQCLTGLFSVSTHIAICQSSVVAICLISCSRHFSSGELSDAQLLHFRQHGQRIFD